MRKLLFLSFLFYFVVFVNAQQTITGKVTDSKGEPLPGVNVMIKGTNVGTVTNASGFYSLSGVKNNDVLVFSYVGMLTEEIPVGDNKELNILMVEDLMKLDEIIVIGYGTAKKRDLTGSVVSVKSDDIIQIPTHNALEAIQGKASGVDIVRSSGAAGAGVEILVRGKRSISGSNEPIYIIDGVQGGSISNLNPNDIESIEILKDASTTAIYGYQGSGGVIIVTTKKAKEGKPRIAYSGYYGINGLTPYPKGRLGDDYIKLRREAYRSVGQWSSPTDDPIMFNTYQWQAIQQGKWVDWIDLMLNDGSIQSHQISVSGGSDKSKSYLSLGYFREEGVVKDNFTRYNLRYNTDYDINKFMKTGLQAQLTYNDRNQRKDAFGKAMSATPLGNPYDENDNIVVFPVAGDNTTVSPITDLRPNASIDNTASGELFAAGYFELSPLKELKYRSNLGVNLNYSRRGVFNDSLTISQISIGKSAASITNNIGKYVNWDNIITFSKDIGFHSFTVTALTSYTWRERDYSYVSVLGIPFNQYLFYNLKASDANSRTTESGYSMNKTFSYAGRLNYSYKGKYLLTATYRVDGASQLAEGHKWAGFPSFAAAWRISDEDFIKKLSYISNLKVRVSYGETGNSTISPYGTQSYVYPFTNLTLGGDQPALGYTFGSTLVSKELTWERSKTLDIGLEVGILKGRINANIDWYDTRTSGILLSRPLPVFNGGRVDNSSTFIIYQNIGDTRNRGIDLELNSQNIKTSSFNWSTSITFTRLKEEIVKLIEDKDIIIDERNSLLIGHPINSFYTYKKLGIWQIGDSLEIEAIKNQGGKKPIPGDIKLADLNGDSIIDAKDRIFIGSSRPDWTMGFQNTFTFKGFDLNIYFVARWGQMIDNELLGRFNPSGDGNGPAFIEYWTPENPTNDFPRPRRDYKLSDYYGYQTLTFINGSYLKLKTITLGYSLPKRLTSKIYINKMRVYVTGSNLFTFTKSHLLKNYDPENRGSEKFPMSRQIIFGVNVDF